MSDKAKDTVSNATGNASGNRSLFDDVGDTPAGLVNTSRVLGGGNKTKNADEGFVLDTKDVKGSLKIHIKLDLEVDIRVIARIKSDIAIGLL